MTGVRGRRIQSAYTPLWGRKVVSHMTSIRTDPILGQLTLNENLNWYETTQSTGNGEIVKYVVSLDSTESEADAIAAASELLPSLLSAVRSGREFACDRLLDLKNDGWLEPDEESVTREQFVSALKIESIVVFPDRAAEFYYEDGDLFWGHTVLLSWDGVRGFYDGDIAG